MNERMHGNRIQISVMNSGIGLNPMARADSSGDGVGPCSVKSRLNLHYGGESHFEISQVDPRHVSVDIEIPLQRAPEAMEPIARFGKR